MNRLLPCLAFTVLAACASPRAEISGSVGGYDLSDVNTVMFGGPFIIFADVEWDCMDLPWVTRYYEAGESPTDGDFVALQFAFTDAAVKEGIFNVAGEAAVVTRFLVQRNDAFNDPHRGREGDLEITALDDEDFVEGNFDITFDEGQVSGEFTAEWCRNLKDN